MMSLNYKTRIGVIDNYCFQYLNNCFIIFVYKTLWNSILSVYRQYFWKKLSCTHVLKIIVRHLHLCDKNK